MRRHTETEMRDKALHSTGHCNIQARCWTLPDNRPVADMRRESLRNWVSVSTVCAQSRCKERLVQLLFIPY
jgi:uncharacterized protein YcgI (DUF1989 family)